MKPKYYINQNLLKLFIISAIIAAAIAATAQGYGLDSSNATPNRIFKCQPSAITANFTGAITSVDVLINNTEPSMIWGTRYDSREKYTMSDLGGGRYSYAYGDNSSIIWGNKTITFAVLADGQTAQNVSPARILVYSDTCTGTGMQSYRNLSGASGLGNYTKKFFTGEKDIIGLALNPWEDVWGYLLYVIVILWVSVLIYQKNQDIRQPLLIMAIGFGALASTTWIPDDYKQYIILLLALALGALFYRIFKA